MTNIIKIKDAKYIFEYVDVVYENDKICIDIEFYRWEQMQELKIFMKEIFNKYGLKPIKNNMNSNIDNIVARMLFESYSTDKIENLTDGLFNIVKDSKSIINDIKTAFICNKNTTEAQLNKMYSELLIDLDMDARIHKILQTITKLNKEVKSNTNSTANPTAKSNTVYKIYKKNSFKVEIAYQNKTLELNIPITIYEKLCKRFKEYNKKHPHSIPCDELVICLMLRYNSLGSMGNQMGIPIPIKNRLKKCSIHFEGFASSLNHFYKYYCSMFYDIEKYFMSLGPFQNINYIKGIYLLNPPYEKNLLEHMINIIIDKLSTSKHDICFVFGTPTWKKYKEIKFHTKVKNSVYYKKHFEFNDYEVPWYDFIREMIIKIPSSTRYILSNYDIDLDCIIKSIETWRISGRTASRKK